MRLRDCIALAVLTVIIGCGKKQGADFDGKVTGMIGDVKILHSGQQQWQQLEFGAPVRFGDSIRATEESRVEITVAGQTTVRLDENTRVRFRQDADSAGKPLVNVFNGGGVVLSNVKSFPGGNDRYRVSTPTSVAVVKGTFFSVHFDVGAHASHVDCFEGNVWVFNPFVPMVAPVVIMPGFYTMVAFGAVPVVPVGIPPGQWKKMHGIMPYPMFTMYTTRYHVVGIDEVWGWPHPDDWHGKHFRYGPGRPMKWDGDRGRGGYFAPDRGPGVFDRGPGPQFGHQGGGPVGPGWSPQGGGKPGKGGGGGGKGKGKQH